jgi:FtsH-binding integral membrane protein
LIIIFITENLGVAEYIWVSACLYLYVINIFFDLLSIFCLIKKIKI